MSAPADTNPERANLESEVIARAWSDPDYKARLLSDPNAALREMGVEPPEGVEVKVLADTPERHHWVIPLEPDGELDEDQLKAVAGGSLSLLFGLFGGASGGGGTYHTGGHSGGGKGDHDHDHSTP